ncbi:MAG TPA: arsenate reductase ArsC [Anaerolineae bacterium]|jgi:arsenate reductase|nr:arsenate reductase ArsC [Anaerolineae bacterium]
MSKKKVLFLCTGNSCRSQMAEGLVKQYLSKEWKAFSAGTEPSGYVHPLAIQAMAELGIDISKQKSKSTEIFRRKRLDMVITVCDDAAEDCPVWLGEGEVTHISFPDPAKATGTDEEKMDVFRAVRDDICRRVFYYLENGRVLIPGHVR